MGERISALGLKSPSPGFRFDIESDLPIPDLMHERARSGIRQLHRGHIGEFETDFKLPSELHLFPLWENVLYTHLVEYQNTAATKECFVHPFALMVLDPHIGDYVPAIEGARLPLETLSGHETRHWVEIQSQLTDKTHQGYLKMWLYRMGMSGTKSTALMVSAGFSKPANNRHVDMESVAMAPNYPSSGDFEVISDPSKQKAGNSTPATLSGFFARRDKAQRQGIGWIETPIDVDTALQAAYPQWKSDNEGKIRFDLYKPFEKRKKFLGIF